MSMLHAYVIIIIINERLTVSSAEHVARRALSNGEKSKSVTWSEKGTGIMSEKLVSILVARTNVTQTNYPN